MRFYKSLITFTLSSCFRFSLCNLQVCRLVQGQVAQKVFLKHLVKLLSVWRAPDRSPAWSSEKKKKIPRAATEWKFTSEIQKTIVALHWAVGWGKVLENIFHLGQWASKGRKPRVQNLPKSGMVGLVARRLASNETGSSGPCHPRQQQHAKVKKKIKKFKRLKSFFVLEVITYFPLEHMADTPTTKSAASAHCFVVNVCKLSLYFFCSNIIWH